MCTYCHERALSTHWTTPSFYVFWLCIQCMCCFNSRLLFFFVGAEKVIIACRDMEKANTAVKDIIESSGNENVICMKLDLSDSKSIREFAEAINKGKMIFCIKKHPYEHTWKVAYFYPPLPLLIFSFTFFYRRAKAEHPHQQCRCNGLSLRENSRWFWDADRCQSPG